MKMSRSEEEKASSKFRRKDHFSFLRGFFREKRKERLLLSRTFLKDTPANMLHGGKSSPFRGQGLRETGRVHDSASDRGFYGAGWVQKTTRVLNMREERTLEDTKFKPLFMQTPFTLRWSSPCYMHV